MAHLVLLRCASASVAPQLAAGLVQASIFVLIETTQFTALCLTEGACCPDLLHVLGALHKPPAPAAFAMSSLSVRLSLRGYVWWYAVCPCGRQEWDLLGICVRSDLQNTPYGSRTALGYA